MPLPVLILSVVASAVSVAPAGPPSPLAPAFGNTLISTFPDGRTGELWLADDGSYTGEGRRHDRTAGHWRYNAGRLCLKQARPVPIPFSWCTAAPADAAALKAGWRTRAPLGETITVKLVEGRLEPAAAR